MIEFKSGDILHENVEALVNTVNCVGVMGRGIALQFKNTFPENFKEYAAACKKGELEPGKLFVFSTNQIVNPRYIINFPTKRHWRGKSRMEDIEAGLLALVQCIAEYGIKSIAIPPLGCGLGGLDWEVVKSRILWHLQGLDGVRVVLFEPNGAPDAEKMQLMPGVPAMTPGRAALVELIHTYLEALLDPFVTLLEVHKLMYFLQEAGEELRLNYRKAQYGPYAENLRHVLRRIEGYFISGYADGGDSPGKHLELVPGSIKEAEAILGKSPLTLERVSRVADLVEGFESPFGLELLATVHWVIKTEKAASLEAVKEGVYRWNPGKQKFSPRQIEMAAERLKQKAWITEIEADFKKEQ